MIKNWEELGEILAEFETRLLFLENSLPFSREEEVISKERLEIGTPEPEWTRRQRHIVNQLRGEIRHLSSKVNGMRAKKSEQRTNRYNKYIS